MSTEIGRIVIPYWINDEGETEFRVDIEGEMPMVVTVGLLAMAQDTMLNGPDDEPTDHTDGSE